MISSLSTPVLTPDLGLTDATTHALGETMIEGKIMSATSSAMADTERKVCQPAANVEICDPGDAANRLVEYFVQRLQNNFLKKNKKKPSDDTIGDVTLLSVDSLALIFKTLTLPAPLEQFYAEMRPQVDRVADRIFESQVKNEHDIKKTA